MNTTHKIPTSPLLLAALPLLIVGFAACGSNAGTDAHAAPGNSPAAGTSSVERDPDAPGAGASATPDQFVACLLAEGVNASFNPMGQVQVPHQTDGGSDGMLVFTGDGGGDDHQTVTMSMDESGVTWVAPTDARFFDEHDPTRAAWENCVERLGGFEQPRTEMEFPNRQEWEERAWADALEFAADARAAGFSWVADPVDIPAIDLPDWITETELVALLDAVGNPEHLFSWSGSALIDFDWGDVIGDHPSMNP